MLQLKTQGIHFTCIVNPCALNHPNWLSFTFAANHQKYWTTTFVKCIIHKIALIKMNGRKCDRIDLIMVFFSYSHENCAITCFQSSLLVAVKWSSVWSNHWSGGNAMRDTFECGAIKLPPFRCPFQNVRQPYTFCNEIANMIKMMSFISIDTLSMLMTNWTFGGYVTKQFGESKTKLKVHKQSVLWVRSIRWVYAFFWRESEFAVNKQTFIYMHF